MSRIIHNITNISRCGTQYRADLLAPEGLKGCHASYLMEICACPGISQDQLSRRICINKSNIARQLAALEEDGFVRRTPAAEDKRVMRLYPTEKTLALMPRIREITDRWEQCLTQDLTEDEVELLSSILGRMMVRAAAWMEER